MRSVYRKTVTAGPVVEMLITQPLRTPGMKYLRGKNVAATSEAQARINEIRREHYMAQLISANFTTGDLCIMLGFAKPVTDDTAQRALQKFIRAINAERKKLQQPKLRYVYVMEVNGARRHIHMVLDGMELDALLKHWKHGRLMAERLLPDADRQPLANYMGKQQRRKVKDPAKTVRRWGRSRGNLQSPKVEYERLKRVPRYHIPRKGYTIVQQSVFVSDYIGEVVYLRMVRNGATDYMWRDMHIDPGRGLWNEERGKGHERGTAKGY